MTETSWFLIWREAQEWTICCNNAADESEFHDVEAASETPADVAATVAEQLRELGYAGQPVVMGLPSNRCLAAHIPAEKKQRDYEALLFALEEKLPVAAEDMVADFVFSKESTRALGIAVELNDMRPLVDALEQQGVSISVLCPTSFLALQNVAEQLPTSSRTICLWQQDGMVEYFLLEAGKLCEWSVLVADKAAVRRQLSLTLGAPATSLSASGNGSYQIAAFAFDEQLMRDALGEHQVNFVSPDRLLDRAARQAHRIAGGKQSALIDLRKHELAPPDAYRNVRGLLQMLTVVVLLFLIGFCAAVQWRARQYQQLATSVDQRLVAVFERTFPGQRVPVGIRSRLESERTKLAAVAGQSAKLPKLSSELTTLLMLLEALPAEVRCSWDRIRLDSPGQIVLEGKVLSHADAGVIVDALTDGGFEIEVPQTEQLPNQLVSVRIRGGRSGHAP